MTYTLDTPSTGTPTGTLAFQRINKRINKNLALQ